MGSIDGATALKLDESFEIKNDVQDNIFNDTENNSNEDSLENMKISNSLNEVPTGVSIESASYIENNNLEENENFSILPEENNEEEFTPKLFSEDPSHQIDDNVETDKDENSENAQLFEEDLHEEDEFEIPAFLRKQKF